MISYKVKHAKKSFYSTKFIGNSYTQVIGYKVLYARKKLLLN